MELDFNLLVGCEVISPTIPNDTQLTVGSTQPKVVCDVVTFGMWRWRTIEMGMMNDEGV